MSRVSLEGFGGAAFLLEAPGESLFPCVFQMLSGSILASWPSFSISKAHFSKVCFYYAISFCFWSSLSPSLWLQTWLTHLQLPKGKGGWEWDKSGVWGQHIQTTVYETGNQQGLTVETGTILSILTWLCPGDFLIRNTGVGCHFLLQGIFLSQGSNLSLLHCRQILYH